jgi:hypothetical protein
MTLGGLTPEQRLTMAAWLCFPELRIPGGDDPLTSESRGLFSLQQVPFRPQKYPPDYIFLI